MRSGRRRCAVARSQASGYRGARCARSSCWPAWPLPASPWAPRGSRPRAASATPTRYTPGRWSCPPATSESRPPVAGPRPVGRSRDPAHLRRRACADGHVALARGLEAHPPARAGGGDAREHEGVQEIDGRFFEHHGLPGYEIEYEFLGEDGQPLRALMRFYSPATRST